MKMIRNKNAAVSAPPLLILPIGPLLMGAIRRTCATAGDAFSGSIPVRFGTLRRATISAQELAQLPGPAHPWLRDFASMTVCGLRLGPGFACMRVRAISRGAA
jgi:hypothetical protein